jgi:hypothetical protein
MHSPHESSNCLQAVAESYPTDSRGSTPSLPGLPQPPPERWQFSLAAILLFTFACAVAAAVARLWQVGPWIQMWSLGLVVVLLFYIFWRLRTVLLRWGRWNELQRHQRELKDWAERARASRISDPAPAQADPSAGDGI